MLVLGTFVRNLKPPNRENGSTERLDLGSIVAHDACWINFSTSGSCNSHELPSAAALCIRGVPTV